MLRFAFVNYTTLGYGDITPLAEWRLLGPMAAMNGILMVGWSAPLMFEVLRNTIVHQDSVTGLQIELRQCEPVEQHDLSLGLAVEAQNTPVMQI